MTPRDLLVLVGVAIGLAGCDDSACRQGDVRALSVGVTDRLNAVDVGYYRPGSLIGSVTRGDIW